MSPVHGGGQVIVEANQVLKIPLHKSTLAVPNELPIPPMLQNGFQEELLYKTLHVLEWIWLSCTFLDSLS